MARSSRQQKKQTRLQFQQLPQKSPAKEGYNSAVKDRLAGVRFETHGNTFRQRDSDDFDQSNEFFTANDEISKPTQAFSDIQARVIDDAGSSSPLSDPPDSSALSNDSDRRSAPFDNDKHGHALREQKQEENNDGDDDDDMPLPSTKRRKLAGKLHDSTIQSSPLTRRSRRLQSASSPITRSEERAPRSELLEHPTTRRSTRNADRRQSSSPVSVFSIENKMSPASRASPLGSPETSGDEDDIIPTQPAKRRQSGRNLDSGTYLVKDDRADISSSARKWDKPGRSKRVVTQPVDDFLVDDNEIEFISSDEESQTMQTPRDWKPRKSKGPSTQRSKHEQEELEEDLLDLHDSDQDDNMERSRTRGGPVTTQRDIAREHFDLLKKRRARKRAPRVIDSDDETNGYSTDTGVDINHIGDTEDYMDLRSPIPDALPFIGAPDIDGRAIVEIEDMNEDDFIVDDTQEEEEVGRLGRPTANIPLEFTSFASAKPKELFVHIVEWMVKNKISPAFQRDDPVYNLSFSRIDDQVKAQAGSRLISSAWNEIFKWAILARPGIVVEALAGLDEELIRTCDACNRTNHPARYDFRFSGPAYDENTLEPVNDDEDDEDGDDTADKHQDNGDEFGLTAKAEYDAKGHLLASEAQHFYLGRFCAANAEMGHKLSHWKYHLNEQVLAYLEGQSVLSPAAIVAREKLNKKKREKEAENIVDSMEATGMIAQLWQNFKDDLEDAKYGMEGHERQGGRGKQRIGSVRSKTRDGTIGEWTDGGRFRSTWEMQNNASDDE